MKIVSLTRPRAYRVLWESISLRLHVCTSNGYYPHVSQQISSSSREGLLPLQIAYESSTIQCTLCIVANVSHCEVTTVLVVECLFTVHLGTPSPTIVNKELTFSLIHLLLVHNYIT